MTHALHAHDKYPSSVQSAAKGDSLVKATDKLTGLAP